MNKEEFINCIPILGVEVAAAKIKELTHKLDEMKNVLDYPNNKIANSLQSILKNKALN